MARVISRRKKAIGLDWQNNNFAHASCTFLCHHCTPMTCFVGRKHKSTESTFCVILFSRNQPESQIIKTNFC